MRRRSRPSNRYEKAVGGRRIKEVRSPYRTRMNRLGFKTLNALARATNLWPHLIRRWLRPDGIKYTEKFHQFLALCTALKEGNPGQLLNELIAEEGWTLEKGAYFLPDEPYPSVIKKLEDTLYEAFNYLAKSLGDSHDFAMPLFRAMVAIRHSRVDDPDSQRLALAHLGEVERVLEGVEDIRPARLAMSAVKSRLSSYLAE